MPSFFTSKTSLSLLEELFPTSFKASTLHVNRELGCGVTEFLGTEVWFPDRKRISVLSPYESNMHANFSFKLYIRHTPNNPILFQRKKELNLCYMPVRHFKVNWALWV